MRIYIILYMNAGKTEQHNGAEKNLQLKWKNDSNHVLYSSLCHANLTGRECVAVISVKIH
jgi:hypothetical protein